MAETQNAGPGPGTDARVQRINAPAFYASSIQAAVAGNDLHLIFSRVHPVMVETGQGVEHGAATEPVAVLDVSIQTAKDMLLLLQDIIGRYETEYGAIETDFSRARKHQE